MPEDNAVNPGRTRHGESDVSWFACLISQP